MVQQQPSEPDDPARPSVDEVLRVGQELLDQSRLLSDALDAQLRRHDQPRDEEPSPDPAEVQRR
jgi:hypothetical protein